MIRVQIVPFEAIHELDGAWLDRKTMCGRSWVYPGTVIRVFLSPTCEECISALQLRYVPPPAPAKLTRTVATGSSVSSSHPDIRLDRVDRIHK